MSLREERPVTCPCCGATIWLEIDCSLRRQTYVEDCHVCCRPLVVAVETDAGQVTRLDVRPEND